MKAFFLCTILLLLTLSSSWPFERSGVAYGGTLSHSTTPDKSSNADVATGKGDYQLAQRSGSIIRIYDSEKKQTSIIFNSENNITLVTLENSTIIKPPSDLQRKIDTNLLNLTGLVEKGYITDNKTRVIWSFTEDYSRYVSSDTGSSLELLLPTGREMYSSKNAKEGMHYYSAYLNYSAIFDLAQDQRVDRIWLDKKYEACLDQSVNIVKNQTQWTALESQYGRSIEGSGIKIAILDTGIDPTHPDFSFTNGTSKIVGAMSFTGETTTDGFGHGTHCASIAAGTGAASGGKYKGVATSALLLNIKVLDNYGYGLESWITSGIQWAVDNGAKILSMSIGGDTNTDGTDPLSTTVNWATEQGAICVAAAGNSGSETYTVVNPATAELAIAVGSSSKSDEISSFSSRGPTLDNRIKPDIVAPGDNIIAARAAGTSMGSPVSQYYTQESGTSMATPHVAGAAALILDVHPSWNPSQMKMALVNYAKDLNANLLEQGSGRLDICKSANASVLCDPGLNIGRIHFNTSYNRIVQFHNVATTTASLTLQAKVWSMESKTLYDIASLNVTSISIPPYNIKQVMLSIQPNIPLPTGFYEGRITGSSSNLEIRIRFLLIIVSELNVKTTSETEQTVLASYVIINADTLTTEYYHDEEQSATFFLSPGNYFVQAMNINLQLAAGGLDTAVSFIVHQAFSISADETRNLTLSLASAYKLYSRSSDVEEAPLHLISKQIMTPYYTMGYFSDTMRKTATQTLYVSNISQYMKAPCFFGYTGFQKEYDQWLTTGTLEPEISIYFIGWDLSQFGTTPIPSTLDYVESDLAKFGIHTLMPTSSSVSKIWFSQLAGLWQSLLWQGFNTHSGISWKAYILPYQFATAPSYSELEWSCIYSMAPYPNEAPEYYVIDRHFQSIQKGEIRSYTLGKTPLLPQDVEINPPYYGEGLFIPFYPLRVEKQLFLAKSDGQATKRIEVFKDGLLLSNSTKNWAKEPVSISQILNSNGYGYYNIAVKTETRLQCSSLNIAEYIINYSSSNTDLIPPSIESMDCAPCFAGNNKYPIRLKLSDNDLIVSAALFYSINDGPWTQSELSLSGGEYSTILNLAPATQKISLLIEATDKQGNKIRYNIQPAATRGYATEISGTLNANTVTGTFAIVGGTLIQPIYLTVKSAEETAYTLTSNDGTFSFSVPQSMTYPIEVSIDSIGPYENESWVTEQPLIHDITIADLATSRSISNSNFQINVTVENKGSFTETFKVDLYANTTNIFTWNLILGPAQSSIVTFTWNVSKVTKGSYQLTAQSEIVPGETETANNIFDDCWIRVAIPGDINADGSVDIFDITIIALAFSSTPSSPRWNPDADINRDQLVDIFDLVFVSANYGSS
jgi:subtilisin family serine protease